MTVTKNPEVRITRRFDAPAERVFDAWLDPRLAVRWLFRSPDGEEVTAAIDARVGGRFQVVAHRPDGPITHVGEYRVIERPTKLVFTFAVPQFSPEHDLVTIAIRRLDKGCELTLVNEMSPAIFAEWGEKTQEGWGQMLDGLATALEA
ncbi:MAG: SRPBCC domain-containing protein [Rhizobiaceae bacterium]|nr:SRPBCC domain-containing protein [Rhizobiaceae bacterium]